MKRMNPLYAVVLLLVVLVFVEYGLYSSKQKLQQNFQLLEQNKQLAVKLHTLREKYSSKHITQFLHTIKSSHLGKEKLEIKRYGNGLKIVSKVLSIEELNFLFSKLLNDDLPISSFAITRFSEKEVQVELELKW